MTNRYDSKKINVLVNKIYQAYGFSEENSQKIADILIYTDLHGITSHGVQRLSLYDRFIQNGKIRIDSHPEIEKETNVSAVINANFGPGQLNGMYSMEVAIEKAKVHGVGIAEQGLIGMSSCNSRPGMIPTNAKKAFIGTNPIAFAMPAKPHNFIFDAATTVVPQGKIEVYRKQEKDLPALWVAKDGNQPIYDHTDTTTLDLLRDPEANVGIAPLGGITEETGGHKGYGLGIMVEVFTSILSLGNTSAEISASDVETGPCQSFIAIDPAIFGDSEKIIDKFSRYLEDIRQLPAVSGKEVYVHGDKEQLAYQDRKRNGIEIDDKTIKEIKAIADRLHVDTQSYFVS